METPTYQVELKFSTNWHFRQIKPLLDSESSQYHNPHVFTTDYYISIRNSVLQINRNYFLHIWQIEPQKYSLLDQSFFSTLFYLMISDVCDLRVQFGSYAFVILMDILISEKGHIFLITYYTRVSRNLLCLTLEQNRQFPCRLVNFYANCWGRPLTKKVNKSNNSHVPLRVHGANSVLSIIWAALKSSNAKKIKLGKIILSVHYFLLYIYTRIMYKLSSVSFIGLLG